MKISFERHALARLLTPVHESPGGYLEALQKGGLDGWAVATSPLYTERGGVAVEIPRDRALTRQGHFGMVPLGVVGSVYTPIQNEEFGDLMDGLAFRLSAGYAYAGAVDEGRTAFVALRLPGESLIAGRDPVTFYVVLRMDHSGNAATTLRIVPVHEMSQSLIAAPVYAFRVPGLPVQSSVTEDLAAQVSSAQTLAIDLYQDLAEREVKASAYWDIISKMFGAAEGAPEATQTRAMNKLEQLMALYRQAETTGVEESAWTVLTSICEWEDHLAPVRGDRPGSLLRARRALLDSRAPLLRRIRADTKA